VGGSNFGTSTIGDASQHSRELAPERAAVTLADIGIDTDEAEGPLLRNAFFDDRAGPGRSPTDGDPSLTEMEEGIL